MNNLNLKTFDALKVQLIIKQGANSSQHQKEIYQKVEILFIVNRSLILYYIQSFLEI